MREIKFRVLKEKGMTYFYLSDIHAGGAAVYSEPEFCDITESQIMQFTGLMDNNGEEIYEGDIATWVDHDDNLRTDEITWENGGLCLCNNSFTIGHYLDKQHDLKVIGNIYENPELLV